MAKPEDETKTTKFDFDSGWEKTKVRIKKPATTIQSINMFMKLIFFKMSFMGIFRSRLNSIPSKRLMPSSLLYGLVKK